MSNLKRLAYALFVVLGLVGSPLHAAPAATFGNQNVSVQWHIKAGYLTDISVANGLNHQTIQGVQPFVLQLEDGSQLKAADMTMTASPTAITLPGKPGASRFSETETRHGITATFVDPAGRLRVEWRLLQADDTRYLREDITITALKQDEIIPRVDLIGATAAGAQVFGKVAGSPVVANNTYFLFENPLAQSQADPYNGELSLWIDRALPLLKGQSVSYSAVIGVSTDGQLRRDFLTYIEAERAHPYRTFLHYNSWYDIGYMNPYTEADALDRIHAFGENLTRQRGVKIDSFMFDDGWDDRTGSWGFSKAFPNGFTPLRDAAAQYGAAPGVWLSPWGGYDKPKAQRITAGRATGYEIIDGGFALSGPKYYDRFHAATLALVTQQGVNQFKLDGTGNADKVFPGSRFNSDFDAAIQLIADLRDAKPDLFINVTTGTYPSPAWLRYADSIWRGGEDHAFTGVGTPREQWMTYRDRETYENIVVGGPLLPLNSVMLHGLIYAQHAPGLDSDPGHDFPAEVHSYFGSGTALQEMYITPSLLSPSDWDTLAEAAKWSRANADVLRDTHWLGGDPGRLDVYGWAAWSPRKAIITLRNPSNAPQSFAFDIARALELPATAAQTYSARSPWQAEAEKPAMTLTAGQPVTLNLKPFEVVTLELSPLRAR